MNDGALHRLCKAAGLVHVWTDARGKRQEVKPETLKTVLNSLGYPAQSGAAIAESLKRIEDDAARSGDFVVVQAGSTFALAAPNATLTDEFGAAADLNLLQDGRFRAPAEPGYYRLETGTGFATLAVAPRRAASIAAPKLWGPAVQVYALRGNGARDFGDFGALAAFVEDAADAGADAVAISPVHALFGARPQHVSPYSPSTRLFLNPLYISTPTAQRANAVVPPLIDWPAGAARKMAALRQAFETLSSDDRDFQAFAAEHGERLLAHARFEVFDAKFQSEGKKDWRDWPPQYRSVSSPGVRALAPDDPRIRFQLFLQWRADRELARAQARAKSSGMSIGLIADMAVGVDPGGSLAWSAPGEMLQDLSVGAPPDIFNTDGQDWGLTTFSPAGLAKTRFEGFIATLRTAMRNAGGMRLDHAMGLDRLWLVPRGASPADGVYLRYPMQTLIRLIALESVRNDCKLIAEDLGTVPEGFRSSLSKASVFGMRVLWFERDERGDFLPPQDYDPKAAALSTTHDLPTIAGWWSGRDIAWRRKLGMKAENRKTAERERARDRKKLWRALKAAECAKGAAPGDALPDAVIDAALAFLARTPCPLALIPVEDLLGLRDQPNLPGTIDRHPNWRRRLPVAHVFAKRASRNRAAILTKGRKT